MCAKHRLSLQLPAPFQRGLSLCNLHNVAAIESLGRNIVYMLPATKPGRHNCQVAEELLSSSTRRVTTQCLGQNPRHTASEPVKPASQGTQGTCLTPESLVGRCCVCACGLTSWLGHLGTCCFR